MNGGSRLWAVVPVKSFQKAKTRLSPLLDAEQRAELASLMLADVLAGLRELDQLAGIIVVTGDAKAKDIAGEYAARTIDDPIEGGPNAAIRLAFPVLHASGASGMIVVPSDVPGIEAEQFRPLIEAMNGQSVTLVAAARDGGTNLLGCVPVEAIAPGFGANSFAGHVHAAKIARIEPCIFAPASLAHDIDRPEDLRTFSATRSTRTGRFLAEVLGRRGRSACPHELAGVR